jgi:hypothetical protein
MDLRAYLDLLPRGGVAEFARECEISEVYLFQLAARTDGRQASPTLAARIERTSAEFAVARGIVDEHGRPCVVTRQDLRGDWQKIWPELSGPPPGSPPDNRTHTDHPVMAPSLIGHGGDLNERKPSVGASDRPTTPKER